MSSETSDTIPWERRSTMDLERAFALTVAAFLHPRRAWERTPESGDYAGPLLFAAACAAVGALFKATYDLVFLQWMVRRNPSLLSSKLPWIGGHAIFPLSKLNILIAPVVNAVFVTLFVFAAAAIVHAGVFLVGARKGSSSGFEGTFRVAAYASAALLAQVVPLVGSIIAFVWYVVLVPTGIARMHRTSLGKAVVALVVPFAILLGAMLWLTSR